VYVYVLQLARLGLSVEQQLQRCWLHMCVLHRKQEAVHTEVHPAWEHM
jgi:hypothetical protein